MNEETYHVFYLMFSILLPSSIVYISDLLSTLLRVVFEHVVSNEFDGLLGLGLHELT
jgi:hypothetical protein